MHHRTSPDVELPLCPVTPECPPTTLENVPIFPPGRQLQHHGYNPPLQHHPLIIIHGASLRVLSTLALSVSLGAVLVLGLTHPILGGAAVCPVFLSQAFVVPNAPHLYSVLVSLIAWACFVVVGVITLLLSVECFLGNPDRHVDVLPKIGANGVPATESHNARGTCCIPCCREGLPGARVLVRWLTVMLAHILVSVAMECLLPVGFVSFTLLHQAILLSAWLIILGLARHCLCCRCLRAPVQRPIVVVVLLAVVSLLLGVAWLLPFGVHWDHLDHLPRYHWSTAAGELEREEAYEFWRRHLPLLTPPYPIEHAYAALVVGLLATMAAVRAWRKIVVEEPVHTLNSVVYMASHLQMVLFGWSFLAWIVSACASCRRTTPTRRTI
jgi:hypothetical protein